ncbi:hypothetical protein Tco_1359630 [Tanacetum coccineum]
MGCDRLVSRAKESYPFRCCLNPEISTQADGAQSSRVPVPLPEDPYEAIRQAYLDGTDTESELFEDPVETETPESPLTIAQPIPLPESTPPTWFSHFPMAEVAAMSESAFRKRFRSSYESSPSSSPLDLPSRKRYREDEDPAARDEGLATGDEGPGMGVESCGSDDKSHGLDDEGNSVESDGLSLGEEEEVGSGSAPEPERPERVSASRQLTLTTWTDLEDGMVYIDVPAYPPPAPPVQTPSSPKWSSGSLPISP